MRSIIVSCVFAIILSAGGSQAAFAQSDSDDYRYLVLATSRTGTMEDEMNRAAEDGYRLQGARGGETEFGGEELVTIMTRAASPAGRFSYRVLATNRTSTMEDEMREAGRDGYDFRGQTVFDSLFGGEEVVVIMERDEAAPARRYNFRLLATSQTSTMQDDLDQIGRVGFTFAGIAVGGTMFGGDEVVVITRRIDD